MLYKSCGVPVEEGKGETHFNNFVEGALNILWGEGLDGKVKSIFGGGGGQGF